MLVRKIHWGSMPRDTQLTNGEAAIDVNLSAVIGTTSEAKKFTVDERVEGYPGLCRVFLSTIPSLSSVYSSWVLHNVGVCAIVYSVYSDSKVFIVSKQWR